VKADSSPAPGSLCKIKKTEKMTAEMASGFLEFLAEKALTFLSIPPTVIGYLKVLISPQLFRCYLMRSNTDMLVDIIYALRRF
jgi:hypothetical protein